MPPGALEVDTRPISRVPTRPPTRWTPTTSSESSMPNLNLRPTAAAQAPPATAPTTIAPTRLTAPQAGVIATRPATMPDAAPSEVALPCRNRSTISQASMAAQVAIVVFRKVTPVSPWNCSENAPGSASESEVKTIEPTLKPYQPNHRRPA